MIDVRFMVPIVRKEDSSNHSHDHTHDRYHRRPAMSDDYPDRSLPLVSALLHTHDRSHVLRIAAPWVGSSSLTSGSSDDLTTPDSTVSSGRCHGLSTILKAHVRVGVDARSAIKPPPTGFETSGQSKSASGERFQQVCAQIAGDRGEAFTYHYPDGARLRCVT